MKVKIVAIAKDEGAYIAEWVFHHLYFGFDAIDIYINRTTDNTCEILDEISEQYPNVNYFDANWVDMIPKKAAMHMQSLIYAQTYLEAQNNNEFTHILFIDIDEYWTPLNLKDSIHDCLKSVPTHTTIAFQSSNVINTKKKFSAISETTSVYISSAVKSICKTNADIEKILIHMPKFHKNNKFEGYKLSDGVKFKHVKSYTGKELLNNKHQLLDISEREVLKPYIVLHYSFRTEIEYISSLYRGNPGNKSNLKLNRPNGYLRDHEKKIIIQFDKLSYDQYIDKKQQYFQSLNIDHKLDIAKKFILRRADMTIGSISNELEIHKKEVKQILQGIENKQICNILEKKGM